MKARETPPGATTAELAAALEQLSVSVRGLQTLIGDRIPIPDRRSAAFVAERTKQLMAGKTPVPLVSGPKLAMHFLPQRCFAPTRHRIDVADAKPVLKIFASFGCETFTNEGRLCIPYRNVPKHAGYALLMESGIEAVHAFLPDQPDGSTNERLYVQWLSRALIDGTREHVTYLRNIGESGPIEVFSTLASMQNYRMSAGEAFDHRDLALPVAADRIALPLIAIDEKTDEDDASVARTMRPALDVIWRTGGWQRCLWFDAKGAYTPK